MSKFKQPTLIQSLIPIVVLVGLLAINVLQVYGDGALDGANQLALLLAATVAGFIGIYNGFDFEKIIEGITKSINSALSAIIILLLIGALAGTWLLSGVVPAMIYYGLDILNPTIF
ncbi:MAG TPA: sodium:proton antiporter, partial [Vicingus sp.]|nr:sodium:proton antiporter [Vicingus sp.]